MATKEGEQPSAPQWTPPGDAHDAVIKLKVGKSLRRIKVDKLRNDANGQLAYKKLVKYAILYSPCYEGEMSELGEMRWTDILKKWDVELKYRDDENDMVTLSSGSEFTEAVQKSDKSLKFIATVKDLEVTKKEKGARNEIGGDGDEGEVTHNLEQKLRDIANHVCALDKHGSLQSFLEMLLTMLTTAFVAFQGQMAGGIFENHKKYVSSRSSYPCCSYKKKCDKAVSCGDWKGDPEAKKVAERILKQACAQKGEAVDKPDQSNIKSSRETNAAEENAEKGNEEESTKAETKIPEHPFVHFRHTCDKCSVSPIVGTRYHATNLPDYDLCAECMSKNTTEDIKFEPEELDRDRRVQHRVARSLRGCQRGMMWGVPRHCPGNFPGGYHGRGRGWKCQQMREGIAVEEAILRSLNEVQKRSKEESVPEARKCEEGAAVVEKGVSIGAKANDQEHTKVDSKEDLKSVAEEGSHRPASDIGKEFAQVAKAGIAVAVAEEGSHRPASDIGKEFAQVAKAAGAVGLTLENAAAFFTAVVSDFIEANDSTKSKRTEDETTASKDRAEVSDNPSPRDDVADASTGKKEDADENAGDKGDEVHSAGESVKMERSDGDAFYDAVNDNEVEEKASDEKKNGVTGATTGSEPAIKVHIAKEIDSDQGIQIVDGRGEEPAKRSGKQDPESDSEWDVVEKDDKGNDTLARATEMMGSALYNSDISRSVEGKTNSTSSSDEPSISRSDSSESQATSASLVSSVSSVSSASTIGSSIPTITSSSGGGIPPAVLARWGPEMEQLREIGFTDDRKSAEAFETLHAANIGVDSDEKVSLNDAINYLLNHA